MKKNIFLVCLIFSQTLYSGFLNKAFVLSTLLLSQATSQTCENKESFASLVNSGFDYDTCGMKCEKFCKAMSNYLDGSPEDCLSFLSVPEENLNFYQKYYQRFLKMICEDADGFEFEAIKILNIESGGWTVFDESASYFSPLKDFVSFNQNLRNKLIDFYPKLLKLFNSLNPVEKIIFNSKIAELFAYDEKLFFAWKNDIDENIGMLDEFTKYGITKQQVFDFFCQIVERRYDFSYENKLDFFPVKSFFTQKEREILGEKYFEKIKKLA